MRHPWNPERDVERALLDFIGAGERSARRQLHDDDDIAAIDLRDEADRGGAEGVQAERDDDEIDRGHDRNAPHRSGGKPGDTESDLLEAAIEIAEELMDRPLPPALAPAAVVRLEEERAHRRRQRQRNDQRNDRGAGNGQRELPVELAGYAGDEDRRYEHGAENQRDGDQRRADLVHAFARRLARREPGGDVAFDVFDDDDGVVDHDADRQDQAEQRQIVQRKAERCHEEKAADQRDRYGDQRNDGGTPGLQEQDHHQDDQHDGLADGVDHRVDRLLDELRRVVDDGVFDAGRKPLRQLCHQIGDALGGVERIGAGPLENGERDGGIVVEIGIRRIIERGELDFGDVAQPHHRAGRLFHDDVAELRGRIEPAERLHRDLERARMRHRWLVEHAGGDLDILPLQGIGHVGRGQAERLQAVRIEPDTHRVIAAAEHGDRADAVDAGQRIGHFERGVVRNE